MRVERTQSESPVRGGIEFAARMGRRGDAESCPGAIGAGLVRGNWSLIQATARSPWARKLSVWFPLTPALSLGERENRRPLFPDNGDCCRNENTAGKGKCSGRETVRPQIECLVPLHSGPMGETGRRGDGETGRRAWKSRRDELLTFNF